ncbi:MAG: hypothetical protein IT445_00670 [Phycisphaeraceae bacterium]|nr:hypothetical protein [Phycisphaeraceae bacterium]
MRLVASRVVMVMCVQVLSSLAAFGGQPFAIEVVDAQTGRGVPLVELRTTNEIRCYSDSAGLVAFDEPGLMDRDVFFFVSSDGYEFPADGFGMRGQRLHTTPGGSAQLQLQRLNVAERLYRVTGQGIYRDSVLLGRAAPIEQPLLNARVMGQDSVFNVIYQGKLYWFWGDTSRESYPLGHFRMAGATSLLPAQGGLDPSVGVNLTYFTDDQGFSRPMAPFPQVEKGMYWLDGFIILPDDTGQERIIGHANCMASLGERLDHCLVIFNDVSQTFEQLKPLDDACELHLKGHPFVATIDGQHYFYIPSPYPLLRVRAQWSAVLDPSQYESFTCLAPGTRFEGEASQVQRDSQGNAVWDWKADTAWIDDTRQKQLIEAGKLRADEAWIDLRDAVTDQPITMHGGAVSWNEYRHKWIMIGLEVGGSSLLGEVWYSEADQPHGPWRCAVKVVTHRDYSFYNPKQHPYFAQDGGRIIYFEGTYSAMFSGSKVPTPRYDYNQIMYRLDLSDKRLRLKGDPPPPGGNHQVR